MKKKILLGVCIVLVCSLLAVAFPFIASTFSKDIAPNDDSDLMVQEVVVAPADNAYFDLIKLKDVIYYPKENFSINDYLEGKTWDDALIKNVLDKNKQTFAILADATLRPKFQDPNFFDSINSPFQSDGNNFGEGDQNLPISALQESFRLSSLQSLYLSKHGKEKEAFDKMFNVANIGQKISESQTSVPGYLASLSVKQIVVNNFQKLIAQSKLSSQEMDVYNKKLGLLHENKSNFSNVLRVEYHRMARSTDAIMAWDKNIMNTDLGQKNYKTINGSQGVSYWFKPNSTKNEFATYIRESIKTATGACGNIKTQKIGIYQSSPFSAYFTQNFAGKIILSVFGTPFDSFMKMGCNADMQISATQTLLAIKAYEFDHRVSPATLNDLVPKYISAVPTDPWDGKPMKYSKDKKIIYSVGKDLIDAGGSVGEDWRNAPDPTFSLER